MITFSDQQAFLQLMKPPVGYRLTGCIGTTYSLDLACIVAMAGAAAQNSQRDNLSTANTFEALQSITEFTENSIIFFQNCQMKDEDKQQAGLQAKHYRRLVSMLDQAVVAVSTPHSRASFHPKVWIARFELNHGTGEAVYRLLVTSRNLSRQMDWEIGCVLEGRKGSGPNRLSKKLCAFLRSLQDQGTVPKAKASWFKKLLSEIGTVCFENPRRTKATEFLFKTSATTMPPWIEPRQYVGLIVVSPFLSADMVRTLSSGIRDSGQFYLVTTRDSAFKLRKLSGIHERVFVFSPAEVNVEGAGDICMGLHAKAYFCLRADGAGTDVFVGSANCTTSGLLGPNTEAMMRLKWPASSFKDFLGTFVYQNLKTCTPYGWLRPFPKLSDDELRIAEEEAERKKVFSDVRAALAIGRFRLQVNRGSTNAVLRFITSKALSFPRGVRIKVSLWGSPEWKGFGLCLGKNGATFETAGGIYADFVHVMITYDGKAEPFMTVAISNIDKRKRNRSVIGAYLQEPSAFFWYLRLVLKMPPHAPYYAGGSDTAHSKKREHARSMRFGESFLEEVLVNASYNPVVCEQIQNALEVSPRKDETLKEFSQFWRNFVEAQEEVGEYG